MYSDSGPFFIRAQDIKTDSLLLHEAARVELPTGSEGTRTLVQQFDLLVTITGANVTKTALVVHEIEEAYVSQHVGLVRPIMPETSQILYAWIVSPMQGRAELLRVAYGAGKPGLNLDNLRELSIALPPLDEQKRIQDELSRILTSVIELESSIDRSFQHASGLRSSVLKSAFSGKLVSQVPSDEPASLLLERIRAGRVQSLNGRVSRAAVHPRAVRDRRKR
ncbi:MAG: restriction endonuclease subunit S [Acidobacteriaceae bacterium]